MIRELASLAAVSLFIGTVLFWAQIIGSAGL